MGEDVRDELFRPLAVPPLKGTRSNEAQQARQDEGLVLSELVGVQSGLDDLEHCHNVVEKGTACLILHELEGFQVGKEEGQEPIGVAEHDETPGMPSHAAGDLAAPALRGDPFHTLRVFIQEKADVGVGLPEDVHLQVCGEAQHTGNAHRIVLYEVNVVAVEAKDPVTDVEPATEGVDHPAIAPQGDGLDAEVPAGQVILDGIASKGQSLEGNCPLPKCAAQYGEGAVHIDRSAGHFGYLLQILCVHRQRQGDGLFAHLDHADRTADQPGLDPNLLHSLEQVHVVPHSCKHRSFQP